MNKQVFAIILAALAASMVMTSTQAVADDDHGGRDRGAYSNNDWRNNNGDGNGRHGGREGRGNNEAGRSGKHGNRNNDGQWGNGDQGNFNQRNDNAGNGNTASNTNGKRWWQQ